MDIKAKTKHGELTLDEIGSLMPGMSELMAAIGSATRPCLTQPVTELAAGRLLVASHPEIVRHVEADQAEVRPSDG